MPTRNTAQRMDFKTANCDENLNVNSIYLLFRIRTLQDKTVYNIENYILWYLSIFYLRNIGFQISNVHYVYFLTDGFTRNIRFIWSPFSILLKGNRLWVVVKYVQYWKWVINFVHKWDKWHKTRMKWKFWLLIKICFRLQNFD